MEDTAYVQEELMKVADKVQRQIEKAGGAAMLAGGAVPGAGWAMPAMFSGGGGTTDAGKKVGGMVHSMCSSRRDRSAARARACSSIYDSERARRGKSPLFK